VTQEFHISVTPVGGDQYLVRTMWGERGVPVAEEQVTWAVEDWLAQAKVLMNDPLLGLLRGDIPSLLDDRTLQSPGSPRPTANLVAFGQTLYDSLFRGTIRDSWMTARGVAQHSQQILRLRLGLRDPRLARLPWEVLYEGDRPIAAGTDVVFSRYHSSFTSHRPTPFPLGVGAAQPLRILMVLAAPSDQEVLALKQEALHLQAELGAIGGDRTGEIELTILEQPGREQLTEKLEHQHYHVFHYAGHSDLGAGGGNLSLVNPRTGLAETLNGDDLAGLLVNNGILLAVLNSCRGVHSATSDQGSESNLGEALVKRGIPAVLAMAEQIPDDVALNLSRLFYRNLKQAYSIDLSLNRARQGLISSYSSDQLYWALPILYLHPQFDGYVLPGAKHRDRPADLWLETGANRSPEAGSEPEAGGASFDEVEFALDDLDLDDLELDELEAELSPDLSYEADREIVAQLVNQLSQGSPFGPVDPLPLAAAIEETLLPEPEARPNYALLPPQLDDSPFADAVGIAEPGAEGGLAPVGDVEMYLELERMLTEAGKLTDAIAIGNRAIQARPGDARAYHNLGLALIQAGYLAEAVAAFQQSIQLRPDAETYNQLGLALQQQGNFEQAIVAFEQAVQLEPQSHESQRNRNTALRHQGREPQDREPEITDSPVRPRPKSPPLPTPLAPTVVRSRRRWVWTIAAVLVGAVLAGAGLTRGFSVPLPAVQPLKTNPDRASKDLNPKDLSQKDLNQKDLSQVDTPIVAALATEQLNQGNIAAAQKPIEALLNRGALAETSAILPPSLTKFPEDPIVNGLMGRLALQSVRTKAADYSFDDAIRYLEKSTQKRPDPLYQNALGSAYYAKGDFDRAQRAWLKSLDLLKEDSTGNPTPKAGSPEALNAWLGKVLTEWKFAESQPEPVRTNLLGKAIDLRQKVLVLDTVRSQPEALAKNWIWTEKAVQDWRSFLAAKAPV
jgi:tetratricopeptide (TPR) repeat protein